MKHLLLIPIIAILAFYAFTTSASASVGYESTWIGQPYRNASGKIVSSETAQTVLKGELRRNASGKIVVANDFKPHAATAKPLMPDTKHSAPDTVDADDITKMPMTAWKGEPYRNTSGKIVLGKT